MLEKGERVHILAFYKIISWGKLFISQFLAYRKENESSRSARGPRRYLCHLRTPVYSVGGGCWAWPRSGQRFVRSLRSGHFSAELALVDSGGFGLRLLSLRPRRPYAWAIERGKGRNEGARGFPSWGIARADFLEKGESVQIPNVKNN